MHGCTAASAANRPRGAIMEENRDPKRFLKEIAAQDGPKKGRLKIFFGYSAGVGKTYAMLHCSPPRPEVWCGRSGGLCGASHSARKRWPFWTGLEQLPCRELDYKGLNLREFDLDGALARRPQLILVDELAHTQCARMPPYQAVPGCGRAAARRHRRIYHGQCAAFGIAERPGVIHHGGGGQRARCRTRCLILPTRWNWWTLSRTTW